MAERIALEEPPALTKTIFAALEDKARLPVRSLIVLGFLAGAYIGLGGLFATVALAGADAMPYGTAQVLAGLVFSVGLVLVLIAGAELFTGNTLMLGSVAARRVGLGKAAKALVVVYCANFAGSLALAAVVLAAGVHEAGDGAVGRAALELGSTKTGKGFGTALASGVLANMLVCLAVWLAYAGHTVTQKVIGLLLPITAFVAAGLEHSVANMYLLPYALLVQQVLADASTSISVPGIAGNLAAATIGNVIGGAFIALAYRCAYPEAD
ncbi:MAG: formate/nitrite transporter family protein [Luteimonas sp.]|nr:formate/nitrite transporter family protein [Luteimonas sp.]